MADGPWSPGPPAKRPFLEGFELLRAVGIATDARKLILAAAGIILMSMGWSMVASPAGDALYWLRPGAVVRIPANDAGLAFRTLAAKAAEPALVVVEPFRSLFRAERPDTTWPQAALMAVWSLAVWGLIGGAIARIAVVQAATGRKIGIGSALRFALRQAGSLIGAPLIPFLAVAFLVAGNAAAGLLTRIPGAAGEVIAALFAVVPLVLSILLALILIGLALGWPLMQATVAAEDEDAADALSRSYSYVNQRFFRYAAHILFGWAIGGLGLYLAVWFATIVFTLADWSSGLLATGRPVSAPLAVTLREGWDQLAGLLVHAWAYSFFWSAVSIVYLILRRDVDGAAWEDVALPEHAGDTFAGPAEAMEAVAPAKPAPDPELAP